MDTQIWRGLVPANGEAGVITGCSVTKGDVISITATGYKLRHTGRDEKGLYVADGDAGTYDSQQGVMANAAALLLRIGSLTFLVGKNQPNWTVPVSGELVFLVNVAPNRSKDNKDVFEVTVTKSSDVMQTENIGGVQGTGGPQATTGITGLMGVGNIIPRPIPGLPANSQLTVTLINNEQWVRIAILTIDSKEEALEVAGNRAISKTYQSTTGKVKISLVDSQHGPMRLPLDLVITPLGASGKSMTFGAQKINDKKRPSFMDVYVHIDWNTDITN